MREIKFRAAIRGTRKIFEILDIDFYRKRVNLSGGGRDFWRLDEVIILQFTGLKDNTKWEELTEKERAEWVQIEGNFPSDWKGREIYEGDLLNPTRGYTGDIYQVIFDLAGFYWFL